MEAARVVNSLHLVVPCYNERTRLAVDQIGVLTADDRVSLVLVDDGSTDDTATGIAAIRATDSRVGLLRLSRNFGHQAAVSAGLAAARGRAVVIMDGDLQDAPEDIPLLYAKVRQGGFDAIAGVRQGRPRLRQAACVAHLLRRL